MQDEYDQFQALEEKIDNLITYVSTVKSEKEALVEKVEIQGEKIADLKGQIESLKSGRDRAKQKVISLLEKIEQVGI